MHKINRRLKSAEYIFLLNRMVHDIDLTGFICFNLGDIPQLRPKCLSITLLAVLTLPRLASQLGEAGKGKKLRNNAVISAGMAPVAKIICQV